MIDFNMSLSTRRTATSITQRSTAHIAHHITAQHSTGTAQHSTAQHSTQGSFQRLAQLQLSRLAARAHTMAASLMYSAATQS